MEERNSVVVAKLLPVWAAFGFASWQEAAAAAAQQKGLEVLGNTGRQYEVGLRLPVLAQTGVIQPGVYVQYVDGAITRTGIVRSTQVEVGGIDVYQTIGVEVRG